MKIYKEIESKALLTEVEYEKIIDNIDYLASKLSYGKYEVKDFDITDTYFDDEKRTIKKKNAVLRLREQNNSYQLIYKVKEEKEKNSSLEYTINLNNTQIENVINENNLEKLNLSSVKNIVQIAKYNIYRKSFIFDNFRIDLDKVDFQNHVDFEIEVEAYDDSVNDIINEILDLFKIKYTKSKPKIARFFENEIKSDEKFNLDINEVIVVVEGKSDTQVLKKVYPHIITFETNGLGITKETILKLKKMSEKNKKKILVLTDPDIPGEIIRRRIDELIDDVYHIYIPQKNASKNNSIGIEHCDTKTLEEVFNGARKKSKNNTNRYSMSDLVKIGIYQDKIKRREFCEKHCISFGNNKKVLKQINSFNIEI